MSRIQLRKLIDQHAHRPTISHDVVQGQHQHMILRVQLQQAHPQQRPVLQIERLRDVLLNLAQRQVQAFGLRLIAQVVAGN